MNWVILLTSALGALGYVLWRLAVAQRDTARQDLAYTTRQLESFKQIVRKEQERYEKLLKQRDTELNALLEKCSDPSVLVARINSMLTTSNNYRGKK